MRSRTSLFRWNLPFSAIQNSERIAHSPATGSTLISVSCSIPNYSTGRWNRIKNLKLIELFQHISGGNFCKSRMTGAMAKLTNYQLWEMGTPLSDAWLEFASEEDKARHAQSQRLPKSTVKAGENIYFNIFNIIGDISNTISNNSQNNNIRDQMREALLTNLFNSQFTALAFRIAPSVSRAPVRIDPDMFNNNDPDWINETLDARGFRYSEIRIVDPLEIPDATKPHKGRIGSGAIIRRTISDMISEGFDICGIDRQLVCNEIIKRIGTNHPKGSGLTPQNLRRYILEKCPKRNII